MQTIIVAKSDVKDTIRLLLELADRPQDVYYPGNGVEFLVPDYLIEKYISATAPDTPPAKKTAAKKTAAAKKEGDA